MPNSPQEILQTIIGGQHDDAVLAALEQSFQRERLKKPKWMKSCVDGFFAVAKAINDKQVCLAVFMALQRAGMSLDALDEKGNTAAHDANAGAVEALAQLGFDFNKIPGFIFNRVEHSRMLALSWQCCDRSDWPQASAQMNRGEALAAQLEKLKTIETLLDAGAKVDEPCLGAGKTPLLHLCSNMHVFEDVQKQIITLLLERGASLQVKDCHRKGVIEGLFSCMRDPSVAIDLIAYGLEPSKKQLITGAEVCVNRDDSASLERFIRLGVKPSGNGHLMETACMYGRPHACAMLLEHGWTPTQKGIELAQQSTNGDGCLRVIQAWKAKKEALQAMEAIFNNGNPAQQEPIKNPWHWSTCLGLGKKPGKTAP